MVLFRFLRDRKTPFPSTSTQQGWGNNLREPENYRTVPTVWTSRAHSSASCEVWLRGLWRWRRPCSAARWWPGHGSHNPAGVSAKRGHASAQTAADCACAEGARWVGGAERSGSRGAHRDSHNRTAVCPCLRRLPGLSPQEDWGELRLSGWPGRRVSKVREIKSLSVEHCPVEKTPEVRKPSSTRSSRVAYSPRGPNILSKKALISSSKAFRCSWKGKK